ncbi:hypothetical protein T492DRAFT_896252, partial [Pavlovales sp. CCMP2436]
MHAPGAAEYCTLVGGAHDDAEGSEMASPGAEPPGAEPPGTEPERRFPCDEPGCRYNTITASRLMVHKRMHSGERPYA